jgi:hypothetical protein
MPVTVEVRLPDGRTLEIQFPSKPTPEQVQQTVEQILAINRTAASKTPPRQPTQAQQLAGALRGTLQRGWNWLRSKLGIQTPQERVAEIFNPEALARHPELAQEAVRIEQARRQASSVPAMLRDAAIAPGNLAAEKRYGSALRTQKAQASTGAEMEQVGVVGQFGNLLGLPQRGAVAWAKQFAQRHGVQGSKYADSAEAFQDAAEWGALLEDLAPFLPKPVRQALSVPMDLILDPLLLVPPVKVANVLGPIASKLPGAAKLGKMAESLHGRAMALLHPTVARALEQAGELPTPNNIRRALQFADELAGSNIEQLVQRYPQEALALAPEQLLPAVQQINKFAVAEALSNAFESILDRLQQDLPVRYFNAHDVVAAARDFVDSNWDLIDKLQRTVDREEINTILKQMAERLEEAGFGGQDIADLLGSIQRLAGIALINTLNAGAVEAIRRGLADSQKPSGWQRAMGWWKRAATSFNLPAGAVRNFLGNFLAHYLAHEPIKLSKRPLRELLQEAFESTTFTRAGDIGADVLKRGEPPKQALARAAQSIAEKAGEIYSGADKLAAAILAKITDKPPTHFMISESFRLPERIEWLSRVGLLPFATWPTWIAPRLLRGAWENPARFHRAGMALRAIGAEEKDNNLYIPLPGGRAINIEPFLPISPYMLSSSEGDLPELLQRWPPLAIARDITDALAGAPARPAALSTESPPLNAAITALNYALPPSFWNALRLAKPEWFADIPRSPLTTSDYLWRLLGVGIMRSPEQYSAIRRRRELEKLRRLMRRVGVRENQIQD